MQAILFDRTGGPEVLRPGLAADPIPGEGEILVRVRAAGVNRADLLQREGKYPPPPGASPILGLEIAGEAAAGGGRFAQGDPVMAVVTGGGYAELCAVPEDQLMPVPRGMGFREAAAVPEAFLTAWLNLVVLGRLEEGQTVLVHAGASGVGSAAIQLTRALGARVFVTAGSREKLEFCRDLGAALTIHRKDEDFAEVVEEVTGGKGVDLVLDVVGAPYWKRNTAALRRGGRLVLIGFLGGSRGEVDLGPVLRKNLTVTGTTLRATGAPARVELVREFAAFALPRFERGELKALVHAALPLAEAERAHRIMAADENLGNLVLEIP